MTTRVGRTLIEEFDEDDLVELADRLTPILLRKLPSTDESGQGADGWLDSKGAAAHLGISLAALHKLTAARAIPFEQDAPRCRCWFTRTDLDRWRRGGGRVDQGQLRGR